MGIAIVVHGGAWDSGVSESGLSEHRAGCRRAALAGWAALKAGGSALDAVEQAIHIFEDEPIFDAGRGSYLNADGRIQMDAALMNGADLNTGAVAAVEGIRHPITLARRVLESDWALIVGDGAKAFARETGVEECSPGSLMTDEELDRWRSRRGQVMYHLRDGEMYRQMVHGPTDTVGAVALDAHGNIVAGTSTGGLPNKPAGRVGDSPLIGCGTYADNDRGGVSVSGPGELIIRVMLARHAADRMSPEVHAQRAAEAALETLKTRTGGVAGLIAIDRWGRIGRAHSTALMSTAYMTEALTEPVVEL